MSDIRNIYSRLEALDSKIASLATNNTSLLTAFPKTESEVEWVPIDSFNEFRRSSFDSIDTLMQRLTVLESVNDKVNELEDRLNKRIAELEDKVQSAASEPSTKGRKAKAAVAPVDA